MRVAIVGRGRLGAALGAAARSAGHAVTLLRRPDAPARAASPEGALGLDEDTLTPELDWEAFDLVLLAFGKRASEVSELERDTALRELRRIPVSLPLASAVWAPSPSLLDAFLPEHTIARFLTTPAARLPGATALLRRSDGNAAALKEALRSLHWIETGERDFVRLGMLLVGSAMAAAALGHLARALGGAPSTGDAAFADHVLDDARRLLRLAGGDGLRAFASVATPGGTTEALHNRIFARSWPLED